MSTATQLTFYGDRGCPALYCAGPRPVSLHWACTREPGHEGDHVAHGLADQELVRWSERGMGVRL